MAILKNNPSPELHFQIPTFKDYNFLDQLLKDPFYHYVRPRLYDQENHLFNGETAKSEPILSFGEFNYIAMDKNQQFVGYIKGYYPVSGTNLWIQILAINKPMTRHGFGKIIIKEIIQFILTQGSIEQIYLTCHNDNQIGLNFWTALGFTKSKIIKETYLLLTANLRSITCIPNHLRH